MPETKAQSSSIYSRRRHSDDVGRRSTLFGTELTPKSSTGSPLKWHDEDPDQLVDNLTQYINLEDDNDRVLNE